MPENSLTAKDVWSARRWCCCVLLALLWCASLPLACLPGPVPVAVADVWQALGAVVGLCPPADGSIQLVVGQIRLARVLLGLLCGGALAVAGVALQGVLRNPLADPFTLGISAGAACGASMAIALGGTLGIWAGGLAVGLSAAATVSLSALLGSLLALGGALWLGSGQGSFRRETVILDGIAVAAFLGAVVALVKALNEESVTSIVFWIMGSLQGRGWDSVPLLLATLLPGLLVVLPGWRKLDMLVLGDEQAAHLGLAVGRTRFWLLAGASCMTAGCVAVAGVIGFVGLVVSMMFYQMSILYAPASVVSVLFSCNPVLVLAFAYLILRADIRPQHITALVMEVLAALIIIDPLHTTLDPTGVTLVLLSAATFALYAVLGKKQCAQYSGVAVTCFSCLAASAEMIVLMLISHIPAVADALQAAGLPMFAAMPFFSGYTTGNLLNVLYICVFVTAGGYACYFMGMEATSAMQGSLIFFFKPVLAPILAMLLLGAEVPWNMWAGIGLMLVASVVSMIPTWETLLAVRPFLIDRILHRQH